MILRIMIILILIMAGSLRTEENLLPEGAQDNINATRYQKRTGDIRNLEASNELFAGWWRRCIDAE